MKKFTRKLKNYMRETYKNKLLALLMIILGGISAVIDKDATAFVFILLIAVPIFFINKNILMVPKRES